MVLPRSNVQFDTTVLTRRTCLRGFFANIRRSRHGPTWIEAASARGEGGRATLLHGIVPVDSQLLAYGDGPLAVFGEVDSDSLHFRIGAGHFGFEAIQQRREIEPVRTLRDPLRGKVPSGAGPAVVRGHPFLAKSLLQYHSAFVDPMAALGVECC
jgi:hypothetical protein